MAPSTASAPGGDRREHAGGRDAAGVVRVEVHRQAGLLLERLDQIVGGTRLAQAAMSLMPRTCVPAAFSSRASLR